MNSWLLFSVLTPVLWAMSHPIDAGMRRNFIKNEEGLTWFFAFFHLPLALLAFLLFKVDLALNATTLAIILAGSFWTLPSYFYFKSLKFEAASTVSLLLQMIPLWTLIIAYLFTAEALTATQLVAFFIILAGGIIASIQIKESTFHFSKAFWFMVIACMMWATSNVGFKYFATDFPEFSSAFVYYLFGSSLPALAMIFHPKKLRETANSFKKLPANATAFLLFGRTASLAGSLSLTYALTLGKASLTLVIIGIQPVFTLIFGYLFSAISKIIPRESHDRKNLTLKTIALVVIIIGLILLQT